jgi:hypothetical protein
MSNLPNTVPTDPNSSKAVVAAAAFLVVVIQRLVQDKQFDLSEEGITLLIGALGTLAVWAKSNYTKFFGDRA